MGGAALERSAGQRQRKVRRSRQGDAWLEMVERTGGCAEYLRLRRQRRRLLRLPPESRLRSPLDCALQGSAQRKVRRSRQGDAWLEMVERTGGCAEYLRLRRQRRRLLRQPPESRLRSSCSPNLNSSRPIFIGALLLLGCDGSHRELCAGRCGCSCVAPLMLPRAALHDVAARSAALVLPCSPSRSTRC